MGSPTGLVLECRTSRRATKTCTSTSFPCADDLPPQMHRLEEYLSALEEERRKIDAFRRELPICMQLLHDAIESYKEKLALYKPSVQRWSHMQSSSSLNDTDSNLQSPNDRIVMEEYIPPRKQTGFSFNCHSGGELPHNMICKPDWMTAGECFQAEANSHSQERCHTDLTFERAGFQRTQEQAFSTSSKPFFHSKNKSGGAFTPFTRDKQVIHPTPRPGSLDPMDLALSLKDQDNNSIPLMDTTRPLPNVGKVKPIENVQQHLKEIAVKVTAEGMHDSNDSPSSVRKARRCWSPELHRRFVNALQQLGGSQVATPKQIRELMQVEGLTNDEVKSHLQKYRLHTRRPSPSQTGPSPQTPQVVVLGGIWVPPDYTVHAVAQQAPTSYNSPQQPPHLCQTASSQELCSELGSLSHLHLPPSSLCDQKLAPAHSQSSLQGPLQLTGHSALAFHQTVDTGREESVGDDVGSDTSSCKGCPQRFQDEVAEMEDDRSQGDSINGCQSHCTSEDEDSRGSDTTLKMV